MSSLPSALGDPGPCSYGIVRELRLAVAWRRLVRSARDGRFEWWWTWSSDSPPQRIPAPRPRAATPRMVRITIDGRPIRRAAGQTVLEVAREHGTYVPEPVPPRRRSGRRRCAGPVSPRSRANGLPSRRARCRSVTGWSSARTTERVLEARRTNVELLLASGVHDCLACEGVGPVRAAGRRLPAWHRASVVPGGRPAAAGRFLQPVHRSRHPTSASTASGAFAAAPTSWSTRSSRWASGAPVQVDLRHRPADGPVLCVSLRRVRPALSRPER